MTNAGGAFRLTALLLVLTGGPVAWAHGNKLMTEPADGATVASAEQAVLHFDQPVRLTAVLLRTADGKPIALPQTRSLEPEAIKRVPLPALAPGEYRIEWRALSADGHPISGSFGFRLQP